MCPEALLCAGIAAGRAGMRVRLLLGDLLEPVRGELFDLVVCNSPYVPTADPAVPTRGPNRGWDAGCDGRAVPDRLCCGAPRVLAPRRCLLIVQSALSDLVLTRVQLEAEGLTTAVVARATLPFGPILRSRVDYLERAGLI